MRKWRLLGLYLLGCLILISRDIEAMRIHFILHESYESPGAFLDWAKNNDSQVSYTRSYLNESLPQKIDDIDFLVIMGGPQSPKTTVAECSHFHAEEEITFIEKVIKAEKLVLGICLGAQLIGEALGAPFEHSPEKEIGIYPITLNQEGESDKYFAKFPKSFEVGHWHSDMPGLSEGAKVLASSVGCPRQIVRFSDTVYGFQCHFEFTAQTIDEMIENCESDLERGDNRYVQTPQELKARDYLKMNELLFDFLDCFTKNWFKQAS